MPEESPQYSDLFEILGVESWGAPPDPFQLPHINQVYLFNPKNREFILGNVSRPDSRIGRGWLLLLFLGIIMGSLMLVSALQWWSEYNQLNTNGIMTQGEIIDKHTSDNGQKNFYYLTYRFSHEDVTYTAEETVSQAEYAAASPGETTSIYYVADDPTISQIGRSQESPIWGTLVALFCNGMVWFLFIASILRLRQTYQLAEKGRLIRGSLVKCIGETIRYTLSASFQVTATYQFAAPDTGQTLTGTGAFVRNDLKDGKLPLPNTTVAVLYVDEKHHSLM